MSQYKLYQSLISTTEMTRLEYNQMRGWRVPANENPDDKGYLVQEHGIAENVEGYKGYCSWKPQDQVDCRTLTVDISNKDATGPHDFHKRLLLELAELNARCLKLGVFMNTESFSALLKAEKVLLTEQSNLMYKLKAVLENRLDLLNGKDVSADYIDSFSHAFDEEKIDQEEEYTKDYISPEEHILVVNEGAFFPPSDADMLFNPIFFR